MAHTSTGRARCRPSRRAGRRAAGKSPNSRPVPQPAQPGQCLVTRRTARPPVIPAPRRSTGANRRSALPIAPGAILTLHVHSTIRTYKPTRPWRPPPRQAVCVRVSCRDVAELEAVRVGVGVGLAGWDGLGGVGWVGWPCVGCCVGIGRRSGRGLGPRDTAAEAPCGMGEGSTPGVAVRVGCLPCGPAVALNGGSVLPQATSPQPPAPERPEWPDGVIITTPARTAIAAPIPNTAYRGWRPSAARHRPRPVAW